MQPCEWQDMLASHAKACCAAVTDVLGLIQHVRTASLDIN